MQVESLMNLYSFVIETFLASNLSLDLEAVRVSSAKNLRLG